MYKAVLLAALTTATTVQAQVQCESEQVHGCFIDDGTAPNRALSFSAYEGKDKPMLISHEGCATRCYTWGFKYSGVMGGSNCFCGNEVSSVAKPAGSMEECSKLPCTGNGSQSCGDAQRMLVYEQTCSGQPVPNGHGCLDAESKKLPFCDPSLSSEDRVKDLVGRLTLEEKLAIIGPDRNHDQCSFRDAGVARLGVPPYVQLVETNSGVNSKCPMPGKCSTLFASPASLAASFNRTLWFEKGDVISTEMRAFNNLGWRRGVGDPDIFIGLNGYGPNINIVRDPRFGRNCEIPSEDPFLAGSYAVEYVKGCQEGRDKDPKYLKMTSGLKHFTAYSQEHNRFEANAVVTTFDLWDTYLPQFELGFVQGNAKGVMCSYNSVNGVPSCANTGLIDDIIRKKWNRPDVIVGTDCGAVPNMVNHNHYAANFTDAVVKAIKVADIEHGDGYYSDGTLLGAVQAGLVDETKGIDPSVSRVFKVRFDLGMFDPLEHQAFTKLGQESLHSEASRDVNIESVIQGLVLLKNDKATLPLKVGSNVAVIGPHSVTRISLLEDYDGDEKCFGGKDDCIPTIGEKVTEMNVGGTTTVVAGVDINTADASRIPAALAAVSNADVIVMCLGSDTPTVEHEGHDRTNVTLPGVQSDFADQVIKAANGKPVVLVMINGGAIAFSSLAAQVPAIVEAWYPGGEGAYGLSLALFGKVNKWGKLPLTIYDDDFTNKIDMEDYAVSTGVGRTYRYYTGTPLYPFGFGLSYTTFSLSCMQDKLFVFDHSQAKVNVKCQVINTGTVDGDEVVMVYHSVSDDVRKGLTHPAPKRALREFTRVSLKAKASTLIFFELPVDIFKITNADGDRTLYRGIHTMEISNGNTQSSSLSFQVMSMDSQAVVD